MKFELIIFMLLTNGNILLAQYVTPSFKISISNLSLDIDEKYIEDSYTFRTSYINETGAHSDVLSNEVFEILDDCAVIPTGNFNPKRGDIFHLTINKNTTNEKMNIFVRTSYSLAEGEYIQINYLSFVSGNYWFDTCNEKSSFYISSNRYFVSDTGFEFGFEFQFSTYFKTSDIIIRQNIEIKDEGC